MNGIVDPQIRNAVKECLKLSNKMLRHVHDRVVSITDLEELFKIARKVRRDSKQKILENMSEELSIAALNISCCFYITTSIFNEDEPSSLLPYNWINPEGRPNPNQVIGHLLTNVIIFSISILELVEKGLDNAARALTRTLIETTWQILILLSSQQDMKDYVSPNSHEQSREIWFRLFGKGKFQKKLSKLENSLNFNESIQKELKEEREHDHKFLSESVHNAFVSSVVGSITWEFDSDEGSWSALGGASMASKATIGLLNNNLFYFIRLFFPVITDLHGIVPSKSEKYFWKEAFILRECITGIATNE